MIEDPVEELKRHYQRVRARERDERLMRVAVTIFTLAWYASVFMLGLWAGRCTAHP